MALREKGNRKVFFHVFKKCLRATWKETGKVPESDETWIACVKARKSENKGENHHLGSYHGIMLKTTLTLKVGLLK